MERDEKELIEDCIDEILRRLKARKRFLKGKVNDTNRDVLTTVIKALK